MIENFLSKKENTKLKLLELLLDSKKISIKTVISHLHISKNSAYRYIEELRQDVSMLSIKSQLNITEDGTFTISSDIVNQHCILFQLREHYLTQSSMFQIFDGILLTDYTVKQLAKALYLTPSIVYSEINKLNNLADLFGCSIKLTHPGRFRGSELGIRIFIYLVKLNGLHTNSTYTFNFEVSNSFLQLDTIKEHLITQEHLPSSQELQLMLLQAITLYRINKEKKFVKLEESFYNDAQFFIEDNFNLESRLDSRFDTAIKMESMLFCFMLRGLDFNVDTFEKKAEIVNQYKNSDLDISKDIQFLMDDYATYADFTYTDRGYIESYYQIVLLRIFTKHLGNHLEAICKIKSNLDKLKISEVNVDIVNMVNTFLKQKTKNISKQRESLQVYIYHLFHFIYMINKQTDKVRICISFSKNMLTSSLLFAFLQKTFSQETIEITNSPHIANLIISDDYEECILDGKHFYFENPYNVEEWHRLLQFITNLIYTK